MKKFILGCLSVFLLGACANSGPKYDFSETEKSQKEVATWQPQEKKIAPDNQPCLIENVACEKVLDVLEPSMEKSNQCTLNNTGCEALKNAANAEVIAAKLSAWHIKITQETLLRDGGTRIVTLNDNYTLVFPRPLGNVGGGNIEITLKDGTTFQYAVYDHKRIAADEVFPF